MKRLLLFLIVLLMPSLAEAVTKYVDLSQPSGCSGAYNPAKAAGSRCDGSASFTSYATIAAGLGGITGGDTLLIQDGVYNEAITFNQISSGISDTQRTTIKAVNRRQVTLRPSGAINNGNVVWVYGLSWVTIDGLVLDAVNVTTGGGAGRQVVNVDLNGSGVYPNGITINDNEIKNGSQVNESGCLYASGSNNRITNNWVHDCSHLASGSPAEVHGIYIGDSGTNPSDSNVLVEHNIVENVTGYGIQLFHNPLNGGVVRYNYVHNVGDGGIVAAGQTDDTKPVKIYYNIIDQQAGYGITCYPSTNCGVYNNTIYAADQCLLSNGATTPQFKNNLCIGTTDTTVVDVNGSTGIVSTSNRWTTATTDVVNAAGGIFTLQSSSSAINGGVSLVGVIPSIDFSGTIVPQGSAPDIGAAEFTALSSIVWSNNRGGSGTALGTANWTAAGIPLQPGDNTITVTATDASGNVTSDQIIVTYTPSFPGNTLAGAWGLEAGSGTTAIDSSGNSNTGTLNGPAWTTGRYGNALTFDGINDSLDIADSNSLDFAQSFTMSAWVKPSAVHTDQRSIITKNADNDDPNFNLVFRLLGQTTVGTCPTTGAGSVAAFFVTNSGSGPQFTACAPPLAVGQYTHVAATYDGTNLKLYINGVLIATTPATGFMGATTGKLQIGASQFGEFFQGDIDEVRIYNYAIPRTAGGNTTVGATCTTTGSGSNQVQTNIATPSVVGDMNCQIVPVISPGNILQIKISAGASVLKLGAGAAVAKFGSH